MAEGGLLHYFYMLDEWSILPSLIFMGVGAMTDFGPLIANPASFLLGAAAQFGIYGAYFLAFLMGFNGKEAAAISIIRRAYSITFPLSLPVNFKWVEHYLNQSFSRHIFLYVTAF